MQNNNIINFVKDYCTWRLFALSRCN